MAPIGSIWALFGKAGHTDEAAQARRSIDPDFYVDEIMALPREAFAIVLSKMKPANPDGTHDMHAALFPTGTGNPLRDPRHPLAKSWLYRHTLQPSGVVMLDFNVSAIEAITARADLMDRLIARAIDEQVPYFQSSPGY